MTRFDERLPGVKPGRWPAARLIPLALLLAIVGCAPEADTGTARSDSAVSEIGSPAAAGSSLPRLTAGPDGTAWLSWVEKRDDGRHALRFASMRDGEWSAPGTISSGDGWFVNWADFPSLLVMPDGLMAAHWLAKKPGGTYAYDVMMSVSTDGGRSWGTPFSPHDDGTPTEHGFVSLFPVGDRIGAVWLDGRNMTAGEGHGGHGEGGMTLRTAVIDRDGQVLGGGLLDDLTCDCCQTGAIVADGRPVVVYRDRTRDEIRDVYSTRLDQGHWEPGRPVADDGWRIAACPVNGPAIDADGRRVAVAWFVDADTPRVQVAFSDDAGSTYSSPIRVSEDRPLGRVDVALLADGRAAVSWLAGGDQEARIRYRIVSPDGSVGPETTLADTSASRMSGFPQMLRWQAGLLFAWTVVAEASHIRTALVRPAGDG